jgi:hypothetical protein
MAFCNFLLNDGTSHFLLNDGVSVLLMNDNTCGAFVVQPQVEDFGSGDYRPRIVVKNAEARGRTLVLIADLIAGSASGRAKTLFHILSRDLHLSEGHGAGSAMTFSDVSNTGFKIEGGKAKGFDAVRHDNEFILLGD